MNTKAESQLVRLFVQASHYSVASLLTMLAGLVSFPLLTRLFSVADYGLMNLISITLTISVALGKAGLQHAIIRYHSEISAGKSRFTLPQLYSTTLLGMTGTALLAVIMLIAGAQLAPARWLADVRLRVLFAIGSVLLLVQVLESALVNVLRAEQRTRTLMLYQVAKKYVGLGLIVFALLVVSRSLQSFYVASAAGEALALVVLAHGVFKSRSRPRPRVSEFSRPLYAELVTLGIPMMIGYELAGIVLAIGDRYVIAGISGQAPLGLYSAGYNLCQYVQAAFIVSIGQAIMPMYMKMWDERGSTETSAFIARSLRTYTLFGAAVIASLAAVGPELLPSLASDKYADAAVVLPWVIAGMVVDGTMSLVGAGLFIHKKTKRIMAIILSAVLLNLVLNVILVPRVGIIGAAIATLVSYVLTSLSMAAVARRLLPVALPWATLARASVGAFAMYAAIVHLYPGHRLITVGVRAVTGAPIYIIIMVLIDADARAIVRKGLDRLLQRRAREGRD